MIRHALSRPGFATLCEKDPARVRWTKQRGEVTCRQCLRAIDRGALMLEE